MASVVRVSEVLGGALAGNRTLGDRVGYFVGYGSSDWEIFSAGAQRDGLDYRGDNRFAWDHDRNQGLCAVAQGACVRTGRITSFSR